MSRPLVSLSLPLLSKELAEQSARRRTYIVRSMYALLLYGFALGYFYQRVGNWSSGSFSMLGTGTQLFQAVLLFQFAAVYALLPMLMAGVLTSEKERDTLGLLLITRLGPWTIVLEKFLSRTIPMLFYLLLSLPLLGVAYSLGGVDSEAVLRAGLALTVCVLQVGALAVFCSAWCRTTSQALVMTYVIVGLFYCSTRWIVPEQWYAPPFDLFPSHPSYSPGPWAAYSAVKTPVFVSEIVMCGSPWLFTSAAWADSGAYFSLASLIPIVWLSLARLALWPRAFLRPQNWGLKLLHAIDALMHRLNQNSFTKGRILIREDTRLPLFNPIAWREMSRRSLGTTRYLIRLFLAIEIPVLFWLLVPYGTGEIEQWVTWWLGSLVIVVQTTGLIAGERSRQSLDVLLATPLFPQQIIREKLAGVWRLMIVLAVPVVTTIVSQHFWGKNAFSASSNARNDWSGLLAAMSLTIYWPLIALIGMECGLRCRTQLQAMTVTLGIVLGVFAAPFALLHVLPAEQWGPLYDRFWWLEPIAPFARLLSESAAVYAIQFTGLEDLQAFVAHMVCYVGIGVLLWMQLPREFSRVVKRCEPPEQGALRLTRKVAQY